MKSGRYQVREQQLISHMLTISKDMLPSFRIVAYYHPSDYEVVSDSVWVEVDESCMGSVRHTAPSWYSAVLAETICLSQKNDAAIFC